MELCDWHELEFQQHPCSPPQVTCSTLTSLDSRVPSGSCLYWRCYARECVLVLFSSISGFVFFRPAVHVDVLIRLNLKSVGLFYQQSELSLRVTWLPVLVCGLYLCVFPGSSQQRVDLISKIEAVRYHLTLSLTVDHWMCGFALLNFKFAEAVTTKKAIGKMHLE